MYKLYRNIHFRVVHFQIFWHWLILCKWMFTPDLSDWLAYHAPLMPWFWTFSWLCASNVCTPFRRPYAFYAKIYIFHQTSITEDNAYMWLPLAFQVQYLDFCICFTALRVVPREFLWPQTVNFNNMSWKLVHCIKNSLNAKRLLYLLNNFIFCAFPVIANDSSHIFPAGTLYQDTRNWPWRKWFGWYFLQWQSWI